MNIIDKPCDLFTADGDDLSVIRVIGLTLDDKIAGAVEVIKKHIREGKLLVVACSFGKDSSVTLALALMAMKALRAQGIAVPELQVMHSDTLMENPVVHAYSRNEIAALKSYSKRENLPVRIWIGSPSLSNNYLVNIIGGRTIASLPGNSAKCQQMTKRAPMDRLKRRIRQHLAALAGHKLKGADLITLMGTRRDESALRERKMASRGESALSAVNLDAENGGDNWVLSPIAEFTTMDVFEFLGNVRSGRIQTYSDFDALTEVYRDAAAGDCMVNLYFSGQAEKKTSCGARTGCVLCLRVADDRSMENMLEEESGKYRWMKPLNDLRNYIKARHFDPKARNWVSRTVNPETGMIKIAPNAYAPDFTLELLRYVLSIDADEMHWAQANGVRPRFQLLGLQEVLAIDLMWGRYAYQQPFAALREYKAIVEGGKRFRVPVVAKEHTSADINGYKSVEVPFADEFYDEIFSGLRSVVSAIASTESLVAKNGVYYTEANVGESFDIDAEGAELFFEFEADRALREYADAGRVYPSEVVHYLMRLGTVQIKKGGHSEWDRMLRVGNQLHRRNLLPILNDPDALIAALSVSSAATKPEPLQLEIFP